MDSERQLDRMLRAATILTGVGVFAVCVATFLLWRRRGDLDPVVTSALLCGGLTVGLCGALLSVFRRRWTRAQAEASQFAERLASTLSRIQHEIRNPTANMLRQIEVLRREGRDHGKLMERVESLRGQVLRIDAAIRATEDLLMPPPRSDRRAPPSA
jgi:signal transduction histidine kinase